MISLIFTAKPKRRPPTMTSKVVSQERNQETSKDSNVKDTTERDGKKGETNKKASKKQARNTHT